MFCQFNGCFLLRSFIMLYQQNACSVQKKQKLTKKGRNYLAQKPLTQNRNHEGTLFQLFDNEKFQLSFYEQ
ncbi:unnamed protein product (macronuclear) [Paramecium tetraurelia]|uniref:Uncharacterized protein n=1 Tax=Paramecium tetraurelia TaxID=5888 RepID=A0BJL5_PARTE|nr:uncharacterized protein GSPATT00029360001 [Paramecium tetraurelia]CAK58732.1 unnamed protein product [Paramecium tetraurelia]|eukprot:XP_001426130.1 hypothetical protein (macronuclear) [Paramecium tetraurelia strain d4-2]